jgi:hypothetical protein
MKRAFFSVLGMVIFAAPSLRAAGEPSTKAMQVVGSNLFVAAAGYGVQVLDISDPAHPRWKGGWNPRQCPVGLHVVGNYAYVANGRVGLSVLDVSDPANPVPVGRVDILGTPTCVHVSGRLAYVGDYPTGFRVVDVTEPARPVLLGTAPMPQGALSIDGAGPYAYATEPMGFHVFDVSDPRKPVRVASFNLPGLISRVQLTEGRIYLVSHELGFLVYEVSDPLRPSLLDWPMDEPNRLPILVREGEGFRRLPPTIGMLTNAPLRASLERQYSTNLVTEPERIAAALRKSVLDFDYLYYDYAHRDMGIPRRLDQLHVTGRYALAPTMGPSRGLVVLDISDPARPKRIGHCATAGSPYDVRGAGHYAYVMDWGMNIEVIDFGDPAHPVGVGRFAARNYVSSVLAMKETDRAGAGTQAQPYRGDPAATEAPELIDPRPLEDGSFAFTLKAQGDSHYIVLFSPDLSSWTGLSTNQMPASGQLRIADPLAAAAPHRFYRAVRAE